MKDEAQAGAKAEAPSLYFRLVAAISLLLALGTAVLALAAYNYAHTAADDAYDRLLLGAVSQIRETLRVENGSLTTDIPVSAFETLSVARRERVYYNVVGPGGISLTGYEDLAPPDIQKPEPLLWDGVFKGHPVRLAAVSQFVSDPSLTGWATVTVAHTRDTRAELTRALTLRAMMLVAIMGVIALAGVALAVRYALRPLHRIEAALAQRAPNDLTPLAVDAPAEIGELVDAINRFMQKLSLRMDDLQRMIADAAHQIRTPITALAAQVELLGRETRPARRRHHLERVQARTQQIGRLVNQLLSHAMVAHRAESVTAVPVDLREVVQQAAADAVPATLPRDLAVKVESGDALLPVTGDAVSLREALRNIIENAVHHGARTRLAVRARKEDGRAVVEVIDDGPGIPASQWPDVTKRFWRAGGSSSDGFGLGLAIAAEVARSHGASLAFDYGEDGSFIVRLSFPAVGEVLT